MSKKETNNATKGGVLKGKPHSKGGIDGIVKQTGQRIETEGDEGVLAEATLNSDKIYNFDGKEMKAVEVASTINQLAGGVEIKEAGGKITDKQAPVIFDVGQAIITKPAMIDKTLHDFNGEKLTKIQILSRINQDVGGNEIKLKDGGNVAQAQKENLQSCTDKKNAYYIVRTQFAEQLAKLHAHKLFRIADLQNGGLLLIYCQSEQKYKLYKIVNIADGKINAINLATDKNEQIATERVLQNDITYYAKNLIMQSGGKLIADKENSKSRFSKTFSLLRTKIKLNVRMFQGRQNKYSQKTVDKIVSEGYDKGDSPIIVWFSEKDNMYYVISGHSRFKASEILYEKGDKSLAEMPVKEFYGTKQEAIEYAVIESNRGGDPESLLSDVQAYKLAVKNGWNKKRLLGYFAPDSRIAKLRDLSFLNPKGMFFEYLGKQGETSFPYIERNARWVGSIRKLYPDRITNTHENEIFNFFWKPKKGKPQYAINKQRFFHLIDKKVATLNYDKSKPLNLENVKVSKEVGVIDTKIEGIEKTLDWLFSEYTHNLEIHLQAIENDNSPLSVKKKSDNEQILKSIEHNIKKKMIFEKQREEAENTPVFDLFSQTEPTKEKEAIKDADLIKLAKDFSINNKEHIKVPPHIFVNHELYFDFGIKTKKRDFYEFVDILYRPYIKIDKKDYERILEIGESDFLVKYNNKASKVDAFTFGMADGGYAIMPVNIKKCTKRELDRIAEISHEIEDWNKEVKNSLSNN